MAWSASGLYTDCFQKGLGGVLVLNLALATHKIALYNNTDTPNFAAVADAYASTNEVYMGSGSWLAGGVLLSAAASGGGSTSPAVSQSPSKTIMWDMADVSVATTTLTAARGAKIYADGLTPKANIIGIYFGGSDYTTSAGTFAITFNALGVATIQCAA